MKKVFLDGLPKRGKQINWKNSIGYKIPFIYEEVEGKVEIIDYVKETKKLTIKYDNKEFSIQTSNFQKCNLGKILNKHTNEFKIEIGQVFKDKNRNLIIIDKEYRTEFKSNGYNQNCKWYKYHCNKCGVELWIRENSLLRRNQGCSCCYGRTTAKGINDIATTHPDIVKYFVDIEDTYTHTSRSNKKVLIKCPDCGFEKEMIISDLYNRGFNCQKCGDGISYPNKFMFNLLEQLNVDFKTEYSPEWIKPKRSDFYIPSKNLIIEMDGGLGHEGGIMHSRSKKTLEECIEVDNWKTEQYLLHGIETIRINAFESNLEYIRNNTINSELNNIFDLNNVDWIKIGKCSEKNIVKEVCDYWNLHNNINNEGLTTTDLVKIFKYHRSDIRTWVKRGAKLGWCDYDAKKESFKGSSKSGELKGKPVEIFKNFNSLGIFPSCAELERQSEKLFGVKLLNSKISEVAKGKYIQYKGYTFKYIENNKIAC